MLKKLGAERASKLAQRMNELRAAECLKDIEPLPGPRLHPLKGEMEGLMAVDLAHPFRLVIEPYENPVPKLKDGSVDLSKIEAIVIVEIIDYH